MGESELTQEYLKKVLYYDPLTGIFTWIERPTDMFGHCKNPERICNVYNTQFAGQEAGSIYTPKKAKTSYLVIGITLNQKTKSYLAHRLVFLYSDGHLPAKDVDHIDGNGLNNCKNNLREVTALENHKNYPMQSNNTSGCVGVCWSKASQKWHSQIQVSGKVIHGGYFLDKKDAIQRRKEMELEYDFHTNHGRKDKK